MIGNYSKEIFKFVAKNYHRRIAHIANIKSNLEILEKVKTATNFLPSDVSLRQRFWHVLNNKIDIPLCPVCNLTPLNWNGQFKRYWKRCSNECKIIKRQNISKKDRIYFKLKEMNLSISEPITKLSDKYTFTCLICDYKFKTTLKFKLGAYNNSKKSACNNCRKISSHKKIIKKHIQLLKDRNIILLEDYPEDRHIPISVKSLDCGHQWKARITNLVNNRSNCPICNNVIKANQCRKNSKKIAKEKPKILSYYIPLLTKKYGKLYSYNKNKLDEQTPWDSNIIVTCQNHGDFKVPLRTHLNNRVQCPKCKPGRKNLSYNDYLERFKIAHGDRYDYSLFTEVNGGYRKKIAIICPKHGIFKQEPFVHMNGHGCPSCVPSGFSKKGIEWLEYISETEGINVQHAGNNEEYRIPGTRYKVDGYCEETNTCYEFLGDFWHGNPEIYDKDKVVHPNGKSVKECYKNTMKRLEKIKSLGYNVKYIWENDWENLNMK